MLLEYAKKEAINSLKQFFSLLGLDYNLFNHLYNIPMIVGTTEKNAEASYYSYENYIVINKSYLDKMTYNLIRNPKDLKKIISNISATLVHEIIHANRTIFIKNSINSSSLNTKIDEEITKTLQEKKEIKTEEYDMLLYEMLNKPYSYKFKKYIPIKIRFNKDKTYTVIAYNRITKKYDCFNNQKFNINNIKDIDLLIQEISNELMENKSKHPVSNTIISFNKSDEQQKAIVASSYYYQEKNKKQNNILYRLENSEGLEESLTDLLADIIIMSRNKSTLDLTVIADIIAEADIEEYEKSAMDLINLFGQDLIEWFIFSAYGDNYTDFLVENFDNDYDELLECFQHLYFDASNQFIYTVKLTKLLKKQKLKNRFL